MAVIVAGTALRPGDAPWIYDEPLLMEMALHQNATASHFVFINLPFTPARYGLKGTRGARYGPIAAWLDQIFLTFTHNPVTMVAIRAAGVSAITALALLWLCRTLRVSPWLAVAVMVSPWLYFYARQLWDNSLCIPISALMVAAYGDFLATRRVWSLRLTVICAPILLLIHFMALPLVAAIGLHLALVEFRFLWRFKWSVAGILIIGFGICWPYWHGIIHDYHHDVPGGTSAWLGWLYPLLGAHHLSAAGLVNIYGPNWRRPAPRVLLIARYITEIAYAAGWLGMLIAVGSIGRIIFRSDKTSAADHVYLVAWAAVLFQCFLYGPLHVYDGPHYFNASWICFAVFAFLVPGFVTRSRHLLLPPLSIPRGRAGVGVDGEQNPHLNPPPEYMGRRENKLLESLGLPRLCIAILGLYAAAQIAIAITLAISVHHNGGMRSDNYGTSLSNQIAAVREMQRYTDGTPRQIEIPEWVEHPRTPAVLEMLLPAPPGPKRAGNLRIHFRDAFPGDARIVVTNDRSVRSPPAPH